MFRRIALVALASFAFASTPSPATAAQSDKAPGAKTKHITHRSVDNRPRSWKSSVSLENLRHVRPIHLVSADRHEANPTHFDAIGYRNAMSKLRRIAGDQPIVTIFGSAHIPREDPIFALTKSGCAEAVEPNLDRAVVPFKKGAIILTGGGPGAMKAANEGATEKGAFASVLNMGDLQKNGSFGAKRSQTFTDAVARKEVLLRGGDAYVVTRPGWGTLDELAQAITAIRIGQLPPKPIVLIDRRPGSAGLPWHPLLRQMALGSLYEGGIEAASLDMWTVATTEQHIVAGVFGFFHHYAGTYVRENDRVLFTHPHLRDKLKPKHFPELQQRAEQRLNGVCQAAREDIVAMLDPQQLKSKEIRRGLEKLDERLAAEQTALTTLLMDSEFYQPTGDTGPSLVFPDSKRKRSELYPIIRELNALDL